MFSRFGVKAHKAVGNLNYIIGFYFNSVNIYLPVCVVGNRGIDHFAVIYGYVSEYLSVVIGGYFKLAAS